MLPKYGTLTNLLDMIRQFFPNMALGTYSKLADLIERLRGAGEMKLEAKDKEFFGVHLDLMKIGFVGLAEDRFDYLFHELEKKLNEDSPSLDSVSKIIMKIDTILEHELRNVICFVPASGDEKHYYVDAVPQVIRDELAGATFDLLEANRCLLFNRNTACVYHCMRSCELVLKEIAELLKHIGSTYDPEKSLNDNWNKALNEIDKEVKRIGNSERSGQRTKDLERVAGLSARMRAVKDAWRNPAMHARGQFAEDVTRDILTHTTSLLTYVAECKPNKQEG